MKIFLYILFFLIGLVIGSFLNVVIYRIPRKKSIINPPISVCPYCGAKIAFYDNIPIISYLILKGRCRHCKARIPVTYPLVELLTAIFFVVSFYFFGLSLPFLSAVIFTSALTAISAIDMQFRIIPNIITWPLTVIGLSLSIIIDLENWWMPLAFSAGAFVFMLIIHLIYPKGMGMGDIKLSMMIGAFLVKAVIPGLFFGFLAGSLYGLGAIIARKKKFKQTIPFGPFIAIGSIIALYWGNDIIRWYLKFF
ncbi:MAG: prepilin peptidase [Actinomycetota bacterium]